MRPVSTSIPLPSRLSFFCLTSTGVMLCSFSGVRGQILSWSCKSDIISHKEIICRVNYSWLVKCIYSSHAKSNVTRINYIMRYQNLTERLPFSIQGGTCPLYCQWRFNITKKILPIMAYQTLLLSYYLFGHLCSQALNEGLFKKFSGSKRKTY